MRDGRVARALDLTAGIPCKATQRRLHISMSGRVETRVGTVRNSTESPVSPLYVGDVGVARAGGSTAHADALSAIFHKVLARAAPPDYVLFYTPPGWRKGETRGT